MCFGNRHPEEPCLGATMGLIPLTYLLSISMCAVPLRVCVCAPARVLYTIIHTYETSNAESMISIAFCKTTVRPGMEGSELFDFFFYLVYFQLVYAGLFRLLFSA